MSRRLIENVFLHVTKQCNLRCKYCYFSASHAEPFEMTADEYRRLWPELVALAPEKVIFTGGEPLLRTDLVELLSSLVAADERHSIVRCLNTNGHLVNLDIARSLVGLVDEVRVSLDGMQQKNDFLRGGGNFDAAVASIAHFQNVGFRTKSV